MIRSSAAAKRNSFQATPEQQPEREEKRDLKAVQPELRRSRSYL